MVEYRFLSYVDLLGTTYTASTIATGYGAYIAQPLLRKAVEGYEDVLTEEQARKILEDSMRVLFYRDARSSDKVCLSHHVSSTEPRFRALSYHLSSIKLPPSQLPGHRFQIHCIWRHRGTLPRASGGTELRRSSQHLPVFCCINAINTMVSSSRLIFQTDPLHTTELLLPVNMCSHGSVWLSFSRSKSQSQHYRLQSATLHLHTGSDQLVIRRRQLLHHASVLMLENDCPSHILF